MLPVRLLPFVACYLCPLSLFSRIIVSPRTVRRTLGESLLPQEGCPPCRNWSSCGTDEVHTKPEPPVVRHAYRPAPQPARVPGNRIPVERTSAAGEIFGFERASVGR